MPLTIPTTFTAVDRFSGTVGRMTGAMNRFVGVSESGISRNERLFRRFTPVLSETTNQMMALAKSAAIAGGLIATAKFSSDQIVEYENNLASFRTIVSDLSDKEFAKYQQEIFKVGNATRKSSVVVTEAFEKVAGLNAKFAETARGLGIVSKAAITLSKASKAELGQSAENLVGIMNQFSLEASEAERTINVLAAGQAVGAASINQSAEAYKNFGSVAASANITLEQSQALIQTLGKFSVFGAEAGTKLRGSVLKLQQAGVGYKTGQFQINDALEEAKARIDRLRTAKEKDAALNKLFGAENISTGRTLLSNIGLYKEFTKSVTGTSEAQKAAAINSNTLSVKWDEMKARWVNIITGSEGATEGLNKVKLAIGFVTDNMDTILSIGSKVLMFFLAWKAYILLSKAALIGYNVVLGISTALQGKSAFYVAGNTVAYGAYRTAVVIGTAAQWAFNAAMGVGILPLLLIIAVIGILIAIIYSVVKRIKGWGEQWDEITRWMGQVWDVFATSLKLGWALLQHAFMVMVEAIVSAWKWGQNLIGNLSDEQYAKDMARIKAEKEARIKSIRELTAEAIKAKSSITAPAWKLGIKTEQDIKDGEAAENGTSAALINPKTEKQNAETAALGLMPNGAVDININNNTPYETKAVAKGPGIGNMKTSSTLNQRQYNV